MSVRTVDSAVNRSVCLDGIAARVSVFLYPALSIRVSELVVMEVSLVDRWVSVDSMGRLVGRWVSVDPMGRRVGRRVCMGRRMGRIAVVYGKNGVFSSKIC